MLNYQTIVSSRDIQIDFDCSVYCRISVEEDYKKVLVGLNAMRQKMFDYQKSLSKEDFERVQLFDHTPFTAGGFYAQLVR